MGFEWTAIVEIVQISEAKMLERVGRFADGQAVLDVRRPRVVRGTFAR